MPSPTLMTVPTSLTVTPVSKFSICWRMMSLISFALIGSIINTDWSLIFGLGSLKARLALWIKVQSPKTKDRRLSRHFFLNLLQMISHRAVVNGRANACHQSANQLLIGGEIDPHV